MAGSFDKAGQAADKAAREAERAWSRQLASLNRVASKQDAIFERVRRNEMRSAERAERAKVQAAEKGARERVRIEERASRDIERAFRAASRNAEREEAKRTRAAEREASRQATIRRRFSERVSERATHFMFPPPMGILGAAGRMAGGILRGAGIDFSLQGSVGRGVALSSEATQLSNQERIATGNTRGGGFYETLARKTAVDLSTDSGSVMGLSSRLSAKTGTYSGGLGNLVPQLASLARASGASFDDVGSSAGSVFNQFKGDPDAAAKTIEVMRTIIGQSAEGAVDMPDYASQLGRVAAGAFKFEGDRGRNIAALSALTQISMERGATSAADAARSTGSFVSTLGKGARLKEFEKAGVRVYSDDTLKDGKVVAGEKRTQLRPLEEIIKDSFKATGGNIPQLGRMYMDVLGRKGVESLGAEYQSAGGGEAGLAAIQKVFDRYMKATISKDVEQKNIEDIKNSPAGKARAFQERLDTVIAKMTTELTPALEKMADPAIKVANAFASMAKFVAENPFKSLSIALTLAVTRAFAEMKLRSVLEGAINRSGSSMIPGGGFGSPGGGGGGTALATRTVMGVSGGGLGALGNTIAALQIATVAVTTFQVGAAYIDSLVADSDKRANEDALNMAGLGALMGEAQMAARTHGGGAFSPDKMRELEAKRDMLGTRISEAQGHKDTYGKYGAVPDAMQDIESFFDIGNARRQEQDVQHLDAMKADMAELTRIMSDIRSGTINVRVANMPEEGAMVDGSGRGGKDGSS
jgi:hypothetical protein